MGLRVISVLGLQTMGFLLAAAKIVHTLNDNDQAYSIFDKGWLFEFLTTARDPLAWLFIAVILIFALLFWLGGARLAGRSTGYFTICNRFDYGVAAFFCLFIIKSLLMVKGGIEVKDPTTELLLFPFFIFGLLTIGLARNKSHERKDFFAGYRGIGLLVGFSMVVLAFGAGLVLFFMPYLNSAADAGYQVLKSSTGPLGPILARVLLLFFLGARPREDSSTYSIERDEPAFISSGESGWWNEGIQEILEWAILGLAILMGLILCSLGMLYLLRWLISRTSTEERKHIHWQLAFFWIQRLCASLRMGLQRVVQRLKGYRDAFQLYRALLAWGRRSGLPHISNETPSEYGSRLRKQFPSLTGEIGRIVEAFNLTVYGEVTLDEQRMTLVKSSWRRLRSPQFWPVRLKSWFF
jgi:hypothetical protein